MIFRTHLFLLFVCITSGVLSQDTKTIRGKWSEEKANNWYAAHKWINGADYIPSNAINQLEMWQALTFDTIQINKELSWAQNIGFNTMRVFLHSVVWKEDKSGFKKRIDKFLSIAARHNIQPLFVFFDDCWNKDPKPGIQPSPKPGIHNSGWMQDPGDPYSMDTTTFSSLAVYVKDILQTFKHDKRILLWDLYNEPGNGGKLERSMPLLTNVFKWARQIDPDQPLTVGVWNWDFEKLNAFQITNSDIISYHDYSPLGDHEKVVKILKSFGRPLICSEYMARPRNSTFETILPMLKKENVGAINWGFVTGKTNTMYAWDAPMPDGSEPKLWFHDIFRKDGTPYRSDETDLIKQLNGLK